MKDMEKVRDSNRERMPVVAAFVDQLRNMGFQPKVIYASENGVTVGRRPRHTEVFTIPANYGMPSGTPAKRQRCAP